MVRAARVVEHLRLRAESESAVRQALPALEDAFHTASLPDAGARLICVRRLHLGRVPFNPSPQRVSRLVEQRFAAADWRVVHAGDASGHDAQAVWFRDVFEAHELAALRLAAGRPLDAWFWPLALPEVMAHPSDQRLRATAFAIAATKEAPAALPAWTASLVRAGYRERLLATLRPGDGRALLRAAGVAHVPLEHARTALAAFTHAPNSRLTDGPLDDREIFVEAMAGRRNGRAEESFPGRPMAPGAESTVAPPAERRRDETREAAPAPGRDGQRHVPREKAVLAQREALERRALEARARHAEPAGHRHDVARQAQGAETQSFAVVAGEPIEQHSSQAVTAREIRPAADGVARDGASVDPYEAFVSPWLFYAAPTSAGGLLFLLPVLEQVGFAKWAAERAPEEPEPEVLAAAILHRLLSRLSVAEDDPIWDLVGGLRGFRLQAAGNEAARTWLTACRRLLRRRARIGLASLVVRPARLTTTSTHIDVFFKLTAADLRIRRAGLDVDPGWVPWFNRVVTFHYGDRPWN